MNRSNLADSLRVLAAEPANDRTDPWPAIRRRMSRTQRRPQLRLLSSPLRAWATGAAAVVVVSLSVGVAVFANQAQTASASEALYQLQVEAASTAPGVPCGAPAGAPKSAGGTIAFGVGSDVGGGPQTITANDANQLSDKLAQALGVSGDRLRQAMRQTVSAELPSGPPPDPLAGIAKELGVSTEQVCNAFANPNANPNGGGFAVSVSDSNGKHVTTGGAASGGAMLNINGTVIKLDSETADQLSGPAQKLGVSPERLLAAIKASVPAPPRLSATPPNPDDIINRLANNLGMSPDKVRAAITQVEGPNRFFFDVPFGH